jgi:simple sugar transport system ATP-binding protein
VRSGEAVCVLGDKKESTSALIKIIAGVRPQDEGTYAIDGGDVRLGSPREAVRLGIAAVYQDMSAVAQLPVWRSFFLGSERTKGRWLLRRLDVDAMRAVTKEALAGAGIELPDLDQPIGGLPDGTRQSVDIARALYFGARVLVLDDPVAGLAAGPAEEVLKRVAAARDSGLAVVLITRDASHASLVGDRFVLLAGGSVVGSHRRQDMEPDALAREVAEIAERDDTDALKEADVSDGLPERGTMSTGEAVPGGSD